jgi:Protein of unknown function (DUF2971)
MHYAQKLACDLLDGLVKKGPEKKERFLRSARKLLDKAIIGGVTPYVVSFCDMGDLLSQWREYGDRGAGFSIAFDFEKLSVLFGDGTSVLKITYDPAVQREILSATIEQYWSVLLRWEKKCRGIAERCPIELASLLLTEFAAFKNPGFKEEQEWRVVRLGEGGFTPQIPNRPVRNCTLHRTQTL